MPEWQLVPHRQQGNDVCVLFIHGFGGDATATWGEFPALLQQDPAGKMDGWDVLSFGYETDLKPDLLTGLWKGDPEIRTISDSLATYWQTELNPKYKGIALVAHSMGGLASQRAIMDHEDFRKAISHLFLFGTPSGGLTKASPFRLRILGFLKRTVRDMAKGGEFITDLRGRWNAAFSEQTPFSFWTVAGEEDEFVPRDASLSPFPEKTWGVVPGHHLSMVKPDTVEDASVQLVLRGLAGGAGAVHGPWNLSLAFDSARMTASAMDAQAFIDRFGNNPAELDERTVVDLAQSYDRIGQRQKAIEVLSAHPGQGTDALGVLGGRYKRLWWQDRRKSDGDRAVALYRQAYEASSMSDPHQAYYHGINLAFMALAFERDMAGARAMAEKVITHCADAAQAGEVPSQTYWRLATQGEALIIAGKTAEGLAAYGQAMAQPHGTWQQISTCIQSLYVADALEDQQLARDLITLFEG